MCLGLCTDFSVSAQGTDLGVMTEEAEQEEPVIGRQGENMKSSTSELHAPRIEADSSMEAGQKVTWDCVWFGSYPQSEVTSSDPVYSTLQNAEGWDSNNDITISGNRYRRMKEGDATYSYSASSDESPDGYYNWDDTPIYHYFKYEPIKWRVLKTEGNQAFLLSDTSLDDQKYNIMIGNETWEISTIRSWLNGYDSSYNQEGNDYTNRNFIASAFTPGERSAIANTFVINADNIFYGIEGGNDTTDKIFLLSESEVYGENAVLYGFISDRGTYDEARRSKSSTYANAMGAWRSYKYKGSCEWWMRSPGNDTFCAMAVSVGGDLTGVNAVYNYVLGVRPALNLNLSSNQWSYAGTVCSDENRNPGGGEDYCNRS